MPVVLRASGYRRTRWKNGSGETQEIAISPPDAGLDDFDWRISMATVASDGPFSVFAGVDRTLCVLDGAGVLLRVGDGPVRQLDADSPPLTFSGDLTVQSEVIAGAVTDFNVMTRRDRVDHRVARIRLQAGEHCDVRPEIRAVFCQAGVASIQAGTDRERLESRDTMLRHGSDRGAWLLSADTAATVCLVAISEKLAT